MPIDPETLEAFVTVAQLQSKDALKSIPSKAPFTRAQLEYFHTAYGLCPRNAAVAFPQFAVIKVTKNPNSHTYILNSPILILLAGANSGFGKQHTQRGGWYSGNSLPGLRNGGYEPCDEAEIREVLTHYLENATLKPGCPQPVNTVYDDEADYDEDHEDE